MRADPPSTPPSSKPRAASGQGPGRELLRVEAARVRVTGDRLGAALWVVAGIALLFTMANVTGFATQHGTPWQIAWLLDPMASLALLVVLVGDGVLARHGVRGGGWARAVKLGAGTATWSMNVWACVDARDGAGVVLHSVAPALVIGLAEVTPAYRARFAALADRLHAQADALDHALHALDHAPGKQLPLPQVPVQRMTTAGPAPVDAGAPQPDGSAPIQPLRPIGESTRTQTGTKDRTEDQTSGRTPDRSEVRSERRSEGELERLVRVAIAAGALASRPSGTAIQRRFGGGKAPAVRVAARLAEQAAGTTSGASGDAPEDGSQSGLVVPAGAGGLVRMAVAS